MHGAYFVFKNMEQENPGVGRKRIIQIRFIGQKAYRSKRK